MNEEEQAASPQKGEKRFIRPQKIYLKDVSFEAPNSPNIFLSKWKPELDLAIDTRTTGVAENKYEVVVKVTATVKIEDTTAYLAEVQQAGIFLIQGYDPEDLSHILFVNCPKVIFPYASAALSDLVSKGGFQQLLLAPVNFAVLYKKQMESAKVAAED